MNLLTRAGASLRARLIPDVRIAWRFASVQLATAGFALELLQTGLVDQLLPRGIARWTTLALFAAVIAGRLVAQAKPENVDA